MGGETVRARSSACDPTQPAGSRPCNVTSYAVHGPGHLWVLLFNHDAVENTANVSFANPVLGPAAVYRFLPGAAAGARIVSAGTATVTSSAIDGVSLPARTGTILVLGTGQGVGGLPFKDGFEGTLATWLHD